MSGLLALLDDVAAIAKVAAASVDDVAAAAAKAGAKTAGVVIDDAAVTPKYLVGFSAKRELPIIWRISKGSLRNKIVFLLPILLLLDYFLPQAITPLLMLGGSYLCFEGAEKIFHWLAPHGDAQVEEDMSPKNPAQLEEERVSGAIKTDFILSAEIMTLALSVVEANSIWLEIAALIAVAILITLGVYGAVAIIVKMDDVGVFLNKNARTAPLRAFGRGLVKFMPSLLKFLTVVGTAAMLWVGGNIVIHGLEVTHLWPWPYEAIHHLALRAAAAFSEAKGAVEWAVTAFFDGIFGLVWGMILIPIVTRGINPLIAKITGKSSAH